MNFLQKSKIEKHLISFCFVSLKANLKNAISKRISVERLNGHDCILIVGHGDEAKALAFVGLQVTDHLKYIDLNFLRKRGQSLRFKVKT